MYYVFVIKLISFCESIEWTWTSTQFPCKIKAARYHKFNVWLIRTNNRHLFYCVLTHRMPIRRNQKKKRQKKLNTWNVLAYESILYEAISNTWHNLKQLEVSHVGSLSFNQSMIAFFYYLSPYNGRVGFIFTTQFALYKVNNLCRSFLVSCKHRTRLEVQLISRQVFRSISFVATRS